ncbi:MAG: alpha/beta hydrolase [Chloroflexi bacterium]|nr:alpha/beta hydrolase [Chloroflexota bacterium]
MYTDPLGWTSIHPKLGLYRYEGMAQRRSVPSKPILFLHGTLSSHRAWSKLAEQFWAEGANYIYAVDVESLHNAITMPDFSAYLAEVIRFLLDVERGGEPELALIAYAAGAVNAYRYWLEYADQSRLMMLFLLAAPHDRTMFPLLHEQYIHAGPDNHQPRPSDTFQNFTRVEAVQTQSSTVLVNIFGNLMGPDFDGVVRGLRLPEAINQVLPLDHQSLNKDSRVAKILLGYLQGGYYQVKLKLVGLRLRREDSEGLSGPVAFEVDRQRTPPDTVFQGITERLYLFEERVPPLYTMAYPVTASSATITLQLRDLSNVSGRRRRMYTRLHIPLKKDEGSIHSMQDSEGSDLLWRVACQRMPVVLGESAPESPDIGRGI